MCLALANSTKHVEGCFLCETGGHELQQFDFLHETRYKYFHSTSKMYTMSMYYSRLSADQAWFRCLSRSLCACPKESLHLVMRRRPCADADTARLFWWGVVSKSGISGIPNSSCLFLVYSWNCNLDKFDGTYWNGLASFWNLFRSPFAEKCLVGNPSPLEPRRRFRKPAHTFSLARHLMMPRTSWWSWWTPKKVTRSKSHDPIWETVIIATLELLWSLDSFWKLLNTHSSDSVSGGAASWLGLACWVCCQTVRKISYESCTASCTASCTLVSDWFPAPRFDSFWLALDEDLCRGAEME